MKPQDQQGSDSYELRSAGLEIFNRAANGGAGVDDIVNYCGALAANAVAESCGDAVSDRKQIVCPGSDELLRKIELHIQFLSDHLRQQRALDQRTADRLNPMRVKHPRQARCIRPQAAGTYISRRNLQP